MARERQAGWLVDIMCESTLPKAIFGISFKPETNIIVGSPSLLCAELLKQRGVPCAWFDPFIPEYAQTVLDDPYIILIGTKHQYFADNAATLFSKNSIVIDPHRYIPNVADVQVIRIGALC
jgi:UDP-N-acetyl-D-mannosaminuronate dehydrogenase